MGYTAEDFGSGASFWESEFDEPLPGRTAGSWIPTPPPSVFPNAPPVEPFDTPAGNGGDVAPGFGQAHGAAEIFGAVSVAEAEMERQIAPMGLSDLEGDDMVENGYGTLGAEAWYTQIAKAAAQIGMGLAQRSGILPVPEEPIGPPQRVPAPEGFAYDDETGRLVRIAQPMGMMPLVVGGGLLLLLMMRKRRR